MSTAAKTSWHGSQLLCLVRPQIPGSRARVAGAYWNASVADNGTCQASGQTYYWHGGSWRMFAKPWDIDVAAHAAGEAEYLAHWETRHPPKNQCAMFSDGTGVGVETSDCR